MAGRKKSKKMSRVETGTGEEAEAEVETKVSHGQPSGANLIQKFQSRVNSRF